MQATATEQNNAIKSTFFKDEKSLHKQAEQIFTRSLQQMTRAVIKNIIKAEMENYQWGLEEKILFDGYDYLSLNFSFGVVDKIPIPRFKQRELELVVNTIKAIENNIQNLSKLLLEIHCVGINPKAVKRITELCNGYRISSARANAICVDLTDNEVSHININKIPDEFSYMVLSKIWKNTSYNNVGNDSAVIFCAIGLNDKREKKLIGFKYSHTDNSSNWKSLINDIKKRGLAGENLKQIIVDDAQGVEQILSNIYSEVPVRDFGAPAIASENTKSAAKVKEDVQQDIEPVFVVQNDQEAVLENAPSVKTYTPAKFEGGKLNLLYEYLREVPIKYKATHLLAGLLFVDVIMQVLFVLTLNSDSEVLSQLFHLDVEKNIPSLYSALQLFLVGLFAIDCMKIDKGKLYKLIPHGFAWFVTSILIILMSIDEYFSFHEDFDQILFNIKSIMPDIQLFSKYAQPWTIIGGIIAISIAIPLTFTFAKIFINYKYLFFTIIAAGLIFVLGAIGFENLSVYMALNRPGLSHILLSLEEFCEMVSISLVAFVFMRYRGELLLLNKQNIDGLDVNN